MRKTFAKSVLVIGVIGLVGCASPTVSKLQLVQKATPAPGPSTESFSTKDKAAHAWVELDPIAGEHTIQWRWFGPNGLLYMETEPEPIGKTGKRLIGLKGFHTLGINEKRAAELPGRWKVQVLLDGQPANEKVFRIVMAEPSPIPPDPGGGMAQEAGYPNSWAVLIGANEYEDTRIMDLQYAERDVEAMASLLPQLGFPPENIRLLRSSRGEVTRTRILDALDELGPKMGQDDRLLVYFSGHGVSTEIHGRRRGYLVTQDAEVNGWPTWESPFLTRQPGKALDMEQLQIAVEGLQAKHKLIMVDSCFSGFAASSKGIFATPRANLQIKQWLSESTMQILTAGRAGQEAMEKDEFGHGVFTWHVLKALQGNADQSGDGPDGIITFAELVAFVQDRVSKEPGVKQTPMWNREGEGEFMFRLPTP